MLNANEAFERYVAKCEELGIEVQAVLEDFQYSKPTKELLQIRYLEEVVRASAISRGLELGEEELTAAVDQIFERRLEVAKELGKEVANILYP